MDAQQIVDLIRYVAEIGMAAGAWRLANALRVKVEIHDTRLDGHEKRLTAVEAKVS